MPIRRLPRLICLLALVASTLAHAACFPESGRVDPDHCWVVELPAQDSQALPPLDKTVDAVIAALALQPEARLAITGYVEALGSPSLGLARVQALADALRQALLQRVGRTRIPIDSSLLVVTGNDGGKSRAGRVVISID